MVISWPILLLALIVGGANWAFRVLPVLLHRSRSTPPGGRSARFLAATGPAAIGTLFVASLLPMVTEGPAGPLLAGLLAVGAVFATSRSVVLSTLAGSAGYGFIMAFVPG